MDEVVSMILEGLVKVLGLRCCGMVLPSGGRIREGKEFGLLTNGVSGVAVVLRVGLLFWLKEQEDTEEDPADKTFAAVVETLRGDGEWQGVCVSEAAYFVLHVRVAHHSCVCVAGVLNRICDGYWSLIGSEGEGLMRLVQKYNVRAQLSNGLEVGLERCQRDWAGELLMFGQGGREGADDVIGWGGYRVSAGSGGGSYIDRREEYVMRAFGGYGVGSADTFIIVAFDGSGGDAGVGVGVVGLGVRSVDALRGEAVDVRQVHEVESISRRMPGRYGDGGASSSQDAEDIGGAAAIMMCLRRGGTLVIGDNLQTVMDIVGLAQRKERSAREVMRHRCIPAFQMMRYVYSARFTMFWAPVFMGCVLWVGAMGCMCAS